MKLKIGLSKKCLYWVLVIFVVLCASCLGNCLYSKNHTSEKKSYFGNIYLNAYGRNIACVHNNESDVYYDIKEGGEGSCGVEERYQQLNSETVQPYNASILNRRTCNSITASHGSGRENGYADNFLSTGCCNYMGYSYTYGTTDIPFYIDESTMTEARAENIRAQVSLWNEIEIHDGTGKIVNLYEVYHTNDINGRPVVIVSERNLGGTAAGLFTGSDDSPTIEVDPNMNVDTPLHEFGHLLGLDDIDPSNGVEDGTHKVLMGYSRGTTQDTLDEAIHYQDIQGVALINNKHTSHRFDRYILNGDNYVHFCFYCDMVAVLSSPLSESAGMVLSAYCDHDYQAMVSAGERIWFKCTRCYKVVENEIITTESGGEVEIESVGGSFSEKITIPSTINGKTVVSIGEGAFANQAGITKVYLPETVLTIEEDAFIGCSNLEYVEGLGVASIGARAFKNCGNLQTAQFSSSLVTIYAEAFVGDSKLQKFLFDDTTETPSNLRTIFASAFEGCTNLYYFGEKSYTLKLPAGVETVGSKAFYGTSFFFVQIGANVEEIGNCAFAQMYAMVNITVDGENTEYTASGGALYDTRGYLLQYSPYNSSTSFSVPTLVNGVAIRYIDDEAFMGAQNLVSVHLGDVEQIRPRAFADCTLLESITGLGSLNRIYAGAFDGTAYVDESEEDFVMIGGILYRYKGTDNEILETEFPTGVVRIAPYAFAGNESIQTVYLPSTVEYVDDFAFQGCENLVRVYYLGEELPICGTDIFDGYTGDFQFRCRRLLIEGIDGLTGLLGYYYEGVVAAVSTTAYFEDTDEQVEFYYAETLEITDTVVTGWYNQGWKRVDESTNETYGGYLTESVWWELTDSVRYRADLTRVEDYAFEFYNGDVKIGEFDVTLGDSFSLTKTGYTLNGTSYTFANAAEMSNCAYGDYYGSSIVDGVTIAVFGAWQLDGEARESGSWSEYYHYPRPRFEASWEVSEFVATLNDGYGGAEYVTFNYCDGFALPLPTREGFDFSGWKGADGALYEAGEELRFTENIELTAQWTRTYNIYYENLDFQGYEGEVLNNFKYDPEIYTYQYGVGLDLTDIKGRNYHASRLQFLGWYTDMTFTTQVPSISATQTGDVTLYAKWRYDFAITTRTWSYTITEDDPYATDYDGVLIGLEMYDTLKDDLKEIGIEYLVVEFKIAIREVDNGYQEILVYDGLSSTSNLLWSVTDIEHTAGTVNTSTEYYIYRLVFEIEDLPDVDNLYIRYGAHGNGGDTWVTEEFQAEVMYAVETGDVSDNVKEFYYAYTSLISDEDCIPLENVSGL